jgi:hypothetical protein
MKMVEDTLKKYLGIRDDQLLGLVSEDVLGKLEDVINEIVKRKVEEEKSKVSNLMNVDDAVLRIGEGLENLFGVSSKEEIKKDVKQTKVSDNVEPLVNSLSGVVTETRTGVKKVRKYSQSTSIKKAKDTERVGRNTKTTRTSWDRPGAISFIQEIEILGADTVASKYGYANAASVRKTADYLRGKFSIN